MASNTDFIYAFIQFAMVLATWSYLYKQNVFSRISAQIVLAISTVHFFLVKMQNLYNIGVAPIFEQGRYLNLVPLLIGLLLYFRLSKDRGWISSYAYALSIGLGTGAILSTIVSAQIIGLIVSTIEAPIKYGLNGVLLFIGVFLSLSYWIFTIEFKGPLSNVLKLGRIFLMVSIGLLYAQDVMWSQSLFIGAMEMIITFLKMLVGQA